MSVLSRFSIRSMLVGALSGIALFAVLLELGIYAYAESKDLRSDAIRYADSVVDALKLEFIDALTVTTPDVAAGTSERLYSFADIDAVYLFDNQKNVAYFFNRHGDKTTRLPNGVETQDLLVDGFLHIYRPLIHEGRQYGGAYIRAATTNLDKRMQTLTNLLTATLPPVVFATVLVAFLLQRVFTRPIIRLAAVVKQVYERNDYSVRAVTQDLNEFRILAEGVNTMLDRIEHGSQTLQAETERLHKTFEAIVESVLVCNRVGRIEYVNPAAERLLGQLDGAAKGHPVRDIFTLLGEDDSVMADDPLVSCIKQGRAVRLSNVRIRTTGNGAIKVIECSSAPLLDNKGEVTGAVLAMHDLTENRLAEEAARKAIGEKLAAEAANHAKSSFLAHMSHEIRTPISAMLGFAETILDARTEDERRNSVQAILNNGHHLLQIINDVLDLSKVEAQKLDVERITVSPFEVLDEVTSLIRIKAQEKNLEFTVSYETPVPGQICSDPLRIKQVLLNLCSNALKFTEHGSVRIRVFCDPARERLTLDVVDTGIGLTETQASRLFTPFTQADSTTTKKYGGTGLGLSLSKNLADLLGGDLLLVQSAPGAGSTFRLSIATGSLASIELLTAPPQRVTRELDKRMATPVETLDGIKILLAEDTEPLQEIMAMFLRKAGATVVITVNGQDAVREAEGGDFDVVLMDVQMPLMDGLQATRRLRSSGFDKPIIALTANAMSEDRERCLAAGCNLFLSKPVSKPALFDAIRRSTRPTTTLAPQVYAAAMISAKSEPIYSSLEMDDPDYQELVAKYIKQLPSTIGELVDSYQRQDWESLRKKVHSLKGTGGNYGFDVITAVSSTLEEQVRQHNAARVNELLAQLQGLAKRLRVMRDGVANDADTTTASPS